MRFILASIFLFSGLSANAADYYSCASDNPADPSIFANVKYEGSIGTVEIRDNFINTNLDCQPLPSDKYVEDLVCTGQWSLGNGKVAAIFTRGNDTLTFKRSSYYGGKNITLDCALSTSR